MGAAPCARVVDTCITSITLFITRGAYCTVILVTESSSVSRALIGCDVPPSRAHVHLLQSTQSVPLLNTVVSANVFSDGPRCRDSYFEVLLLE